MCGLHSRHTRGQFNCLSVGNKQSLCPLMWGHKRKVGGHQKNFGRRCAGIAYPHLQIASDATVLYCIHYCIQNLRLHRCLTGRSQGMKGRDRGCCFWGITCPAASLIIYFIYKFLSCLILQNKCLAAKEGQSVVAESDTDCISADRL